MLALEREFGIGQVLTSSVPFRSGKYREIVEGLDWSSSPDSYR